MFSQLLIAYGLVLVAIEGKKNAKKRLDELFVRLDAFYKNDWFAAGNEPDFQVPWIYNWTNSPYKTSEIIHRIFMKFIIVPHLVYPEMMM